MSHFELVRIGLVQQQRVARRAQLGFGHRLAQGRVVDIAHQLAHVLQLAPPAFVAARAAVLQQRVEQPFGQAQLLQARVGQLGQGHAQLLQIVRLLLEPGLARCVVAVGRGGNSSWKDGSTGHGRGSAD